jgi:molecular chaperone GrpE
MPPSDFKEGFALNDQNFAAGAGAPADAPPAEGLEPAAALAAAEARATESRNSYLRAVAEMENLRKRSEREVENARKFAIERFAQELVTVGDALEAGVSAGPSASQAALLEGQQATLQQLYRAFDKGGIKIIDPAGQPFNPEWHEAMAAVDGAGQPANTVMKVVQKGYSLNGRLLRPARVLVSKAPDGN